MKTGYFLDNKYLDMYVDLLYKNRNTLYIRNATNNHHIIPKSYYKRLKKPINNSSENIVTVLFKDHVLAHYYLYLCTLNEEDKYSNACALNHLTGDYPKDAELISTLMTFRSQSYKKYMKKVNVILQNL